MNPLEIPIAIRAYAVPKKSEGGMWDERTGWRNQQYGERALIFDTETTVDAYQNLLVGSFLVLEKADATYHALGYRVACHDAPRPGRGLIVGDGLTRRELDIVRKFAEEHPIQIVRRGYARLEHRPVLSRDEFVHEVFYPEVHELGSLSVGYHLGFDLTRLAVRCTIGRKRNRDAFRIEFCGHLQHPAVYLQIVSNKQQFIRFSSLPPPQGRKRKPGRLTFHGRFLDLRQVVYGLTGDAVDLESDCAKFGHEVGKLAVPQLGVLTPELIAYNIHDTEALTAGLFIGVRQSYFEYRDIATADSEYYLQRRKRITEIYSPASIGKAHLDIMGIVPPPLLVVSAEKS